jgi:hypothetical protein
MQNSNYQEKDERFHNFFGGNNQEFADQRPLQLLLASRALAERQDGSCCGNDVHDSYEGLLGHPLIPDARKRQNHGAA